MSDPYAVLGVPRNASPSEIKKAYKTLAARYHPDKHRGNELEDLAREKLKDLNEAYEILSNPERRARFDEARSGSRGNAADARPPGAPAREISAQSLIWSVVRLVIIIALVFLSMRFIRSPRAMAVVAAVILIAWFGPRLIGKLKSRK